MKNWRTTIAGAIAGGLTAILPQLGAEDLDWKAILLGFVIAVMGYVSKDAGVSGTTK